MKPRHIYNKHKIQYSFDQYQLIKPLIFLLIQLFSFFYIFSSTDPRTIPKLSSKVINYNIPYKHHLTHQFSIEPSTKNSGTDHCPHITFYTPLVPVTNYHLIAEDGGPSHDIQNEPHMSEFKLHLIDNVYVGDACQYAHYQFQKFYYSTPYTQMYKREENASLTFRGAFDLVIGFSQGLSMFDYVFYYDFLGFITLLPQELLKKSHIIVPMITKPFLNSFEAIGINERQIIFLQDYQYIFAYKYLTPEEIPIYAGNTYVVRRLRDIFKRKYHLDETKPTQFVFSFDDKQELFWELTNRFPGINWILYSPKVTLEDTIRYYNSVAMLYEQPSFHDMNNVFMQNGTVLCQVSSSSFDSRFSVQMAGLGVSQIYIRRNGERINTKHAFAQVETGLKILNQTVLKGLLNEDGSLKEG